VKVGLARHRAFVARRVLAVAAAGAVLAGVWAAGGDALLHEPERVGAWLRETGPFGPAVYVLVFAACQAVGVPGFAFLIPGILVWPAKEAFLWVWLGATASGVAGFAFARWLAREWVESKLPERLRRVDARMGERAFVTVVLVRSFFYLAPPSHWALGVSRVGVAPLVAGTALGMLPGTAFWVLAGKGVLAFAATQPPAVWIALALALGVAALVWRAKHRRAAAAVEEALRAAPAAPPEQPAD
jgi:uncharacterized membrane protein YdjX (TVP38/TMEM64 family)